MRKPGVLVVNEHFDGDEVGRAVVVDEPSDVAVLVGVDAISLTTVLKTIKQLKHIHFTKKIGFCHLGNLAKFKKYLSSDAGYIYT